MTNTLASKTSTAKIDKLHCELDALLKSKRDLTKAAAERVLDVLENTVRCGWVILDIKDQLKGNFVTFDEYAEKHFPFSTRQAERLMQAARNFQRDEQNVTFLQSIADAKTALLFAPSDMPLRTQIKVSGARYFQDLLVTSGIAPARTLPDTETRIDSPPICRLSRMFDRGYEQFVRLARETPVSEWSDTDKEVVRRKLEPLMGIYRELE